MYVPPADALRPTLGAAQRVEPLNVDGHRRVHRDGPEAKLPEVRVVEVGVVNILTATYLRCAQFIYDIHTQNCSIWFYQVIPVYICI